MRQAIKALFVFPVSQVWGGEKIWLDYLERMERTKIIPCALVFGKGELLDRVQKLKIDYYCLPAARIRNPVSFLMNLFKMLAILKKERFDIVNSLGVHFLTTLATAILKVKYILHIHTIHRLPLIDRWCLHRAKHIITVSKFSKTFLEDYGIRPEYIQVVYNGIDIERLENEREGRDIREELNLDKDIQIVCYAGRIVKWKNLEMLIRAIPKIRKSYSGKVKFLFVGDASKIRQGEEDYKNTLLKLAEELQVRDEIILTGRRKDIASILKQIDIFVIPSLLEVCSMSILEAMSLANPVVALKIGGNPELITENTGILVGSDDLDGFSSAIVSLLEDKAKRQKMGLAASSRIKEYFDLEEKTRKFEYIQEKASLDYGALKDIIKTDIFPLTDRVDFLHIKRRAAAVVIKARVGLSSGKANTCWIKINQVFFSDFLKGKEIAAREYEILTKLHEEFSKEGMLGTIKPLGIISDYAAIITEDCLGRELEDMVIRYCLYPGILVKDNLEKILFDCGRWLAKFQRITPSSQDLPNTNRFLEDRQIKSDLTALANMGVDREALKKLKDYLLKTAPFIRGQSFQAVTYHPDFGPRNFIVNPKGKIVVLDFDDLEYRRGLEDVALFMVHLDLYLRDPGVKQNKIKILNNLFLEGYQKESGSLINMPDLRFWLVRHMVGTSAGEWYAAKKRNSVLRWFIYKRTKDFLKKWAAENVCE
jgi:glycosyltransferase involved in cell wall biosynthesis